MNLTTTEIGIIVAVAAAIIAVLALRRSGPRVTQIDHTIRRKGDDDA